MAYNEFAYFYDEFNGEADYDALYAHIRTARSMQSWKLTASMTALWPTLAAAPGS